HLLAVNKPAGLNTHAPAPYAGEGIYDWLRHREPRWANLAIMHRLDKETSGVLVFAKTALANRSLTRQFTERQVRKKYVLITDRPVKSRTPRVVSTLVRAGEKYVSRAGGLPKDQAETRFRVRKADGHRTILEAEPITGRTHQIRVHAADQGFPILGDTLYGGSAAPRLFLHSEELALKHPVASAPIAFRAEADFSVDPRAGPRSALIDPRETNAHRLLHGASDGWPGWYVDRFGDYLLSQSAEPLSEAQEKQIEEWRARLSLRGAYHKTLLRRVRQATADQGGLRLIAGEVAPESFAVRENGVQFEIRFGEGYSVGLFLDQRENRRRFLTRHLAAGFALTPESGRQLEVLNAFAYTCGFSMCAAQSGARVTSLDLSKKYLEWGRRNFLLNQLSPDEHEFIYGDAFDWLSRLSRKGRMFDVVALDPPTFSQSKEFGPFQVEKHYGQLVGACLPLLRRNGVLFASANASGWSPDAFRETVKRVIASAARGIVREHYVPQPPDFSVSRTEPAYLKTVWIEIE
ncbi:MAG: class I SAM-dependent methyltransferase, partial [Verrucomicrobia bacterium]|nr:class I SAM-dependent methyltransferase [Verrucomicrobiota bacterium]